MATKFITLKQIMDEVRPSRNLEDHINEVHGGEDDGLEDDAHSNVTSITDQVSPGWKPNTMSVDAIRNFYPRKGGQPGCRVVMKTGVAYAVLDDHADILALING